ncbi:hypothetical protein [Bacteroides acidifaciens]|mgnify:FL=1|uniref:hypothetical protein n=1 Tax=Bacteroides acidifaciens TaxID=85831 RepID=UPI0030144D02
MQEEIKTRGWEMQRVCYTEFVYVEYNDCNGFTYEDPEYGLGFGTECRKVGKWEPVERCHDELVYVQEPWYPGPGEGGGNGGGNGGNSYNESDWIKGKIRGDKRMLSTEKLEYYIDKKGNFYGDSINFEIY